ncbi:MAG: hypothetical protein JNL21_32220 [Myxococcales bacterium]|nr:hypothetical protein [Myxococcales bacterium]
MTRRRKLLLGGAALVAVAAGAALTRACVGFPPDTTPEGAYLRIAYALSHGNAPMVFPYLEDAAQHAAYTIRDYRKQARDLVQRDFPEPERSRLVALYAAHADAADGSDVFVSMANEHGWLGRLRKDLSGVASVDVQGERATVVTARGTRYAFRRRDNGIWGLTLFTGELVAEAERAARDFDVVKKAAEDYRHGGAP